MGVARRIIESALRHYNNRLSTGLCAALGNMLGKETLLRVFFFYTSSPILIALPSSRSKAGTAVRNALSSLRRRK